MVYRKLLVIIAGIVFLVLILRVGKGCHICDPICCWDKKNDCLGSPQSCIGIKTGGCVDLGGCFMYFTDTHDLYCTIYNCELRSLTDWHRIGDPFYPSNGETCKVLWGTICAGEYSGKWDSSEGKCVGCSNSFENNRYYCSGDFGYSGEGDKECESACGASSQCDERNPGALPDKCGTTTLEVNRNCDSNCAYSSTTYTCNSNNCGAVKSCGGSTYYCVYDNGWKWSTTWITNFCCADHYCSGYDPTTHIKLVCECPSGCSLIGQSYRCKPKPTCANNTECDHGWCCDRDLSLPLSCRGSGACASHGNLRCSNQYLCDPPERSFKEVNEKKSLFELILNFFNPFS